MMKLELSVRSEFYKEIFPKWGEEKMREVIRHERSVRATPPEPEVKVKRAKERMKSLVGELSESEQREFLEMMKRKREGI